MFPTEVCGLGPRCLLRTFNFSHTGVSSLHSSCSSCFSITIGQCSSEGVREQLSAPCGWLVRGLHVGDELGAGDMQHCGLTSLMRKKQTTKICKWWEMHTRAHKAVCGSSSTGSSSHALAGFAPCWSVLEQNTLNPWQLQECCSEADPDLWLPSGGDQEIRKCPLREPAKMSSDYF